MLKSSFLFAALLAPIAALYADAPPPPNPAVDAGENWPGRRKQLEKEWLKLLGPFPAAKPPLDLQVLSTEVVLAAPDDPSYPIRAGDITRYKVKFRSEADAGGGTQSDIWIYGWLLVPKSATEAHEEHGTKSPAIICLHSTTFGAGKSSPAGVAGRFASDPKAGFVGRPDLVGKDLRYDNNLPDPNDPVAMRNYDASGRATGLLLAKQGFVTLSIDLLADGDRIEPGQRSNDTRQFYKQRYPDLMADSAWSIIGKAVWDVMRSVDYLQSLPYVNADGIGCTGWSYGGHVALFAAAFDQRIAAAVPNGGVLDWDRPKYPAGYPGKPKANAWCRQPATMEPWTPDGTEPPSGGAESLRRWGFLQNSGPVLYIPKFYKYTLPENRDLALPVGFESLMMMIAPRPLLVLSSEIEFKQHDILPKCLETMKVYAQWRDVKNSCLPSPLAARKNRTGYAQTHDYYVNNNGYSPEAIDSYLNSLGAGDCFSWFSFPGGHSYPFSAQMVTTGWFGRWLGLHPAAPVPQLPQIPADEALHIGPLGRDAAASVAPLVGKPPSNQDPAVKPATKENIIVYKEPGRYGGWPANQGLWQWGDELVAGFTATYYKETTTDHRIDRTKPSHRIQARSLDGGKTWKVEEDQPYSDRKNEPEAVALKEPLDFTAPNFAMMFRFKGLHVGPSYFYTTHDRCRTWQGPFQFDVEGVDGISTRTDLIPLGPHECLMFGSCGKKSDNKEGRVFCARTTDGGLTWKLQGYIGKEPPPGGFAIMPSSVRAKGGALLTTIRIGKPEFTIQLWRSDDLGKSWSKVSDVTGNIGGNPPATVLLPDGRLCVTYGHRKKPFGIRARISSDEGKTWTPEIILRDDGFDGDLGYPRTLVRPDGRVLTIYYFNGPSAEDRAIEGTFWTPMP